MSYHKPLCKRRKTANRRLSARGMSDARHTFEVMCSRAARAGEPPPSFAASPCGCSDACTMTWPLQPKEQDASSPPDAV